MHSFTDKTIPYFAWDRSLTAGQIRRLLENGDDQEKASLTAWLLREAAFSDVWQFLSPVKVAEELPLIQKQLGRKKDFWTYIIRTWNELGKI
jgi:hypothetical protein